VPDRLAALVALNPPSLARYESLLAPGGMLVVNDSLIEADPSRTDVEVVRVPCTASAKQIGDERLTCVVALGALLARRHLAGRPAIEVAIGELLGAKGPAVIAADIAALEAGWRAAEPRDRVVAAEP